MNTNKTIRKTWSTIMMVKVAVLVAISAVGGMVKIPSPTGSVALDSAPAYFAVLFLGFKEAALVAALGHLLSAMTAGFSMTVPVHLFVAAQMAVAVVIFGLVAKKANYMIAVPVAVLLNGVGAPALLIPIFGYGFFVAMVVPLIVASLVNVILAVLVYNSLKDRLN